MFPTIENIVQELRNLQAFLEKDPEIEDCDVRLQVTPGAWYLHTGDSSYDQDHSGYWGASSIDREMGAKTLCDVARGLIAEARDDMAEDQAIAAVSV